jgi:serine protease AprX
MITNPNGMFTPSRWRRLFCSLFFVAAAIAALGAIALSRAIGQGAPPSAGDAASKIAPWVMEHTANGQQAEFMVVLTDQADLRPAAALATKNEKGRYVYDALLNKGETTQGPILQWLRERGIEYRSFYIVNAILVKGSREIAEALAARSDVARVEGNPHIQNFPLPLPAVEAPSQPQFPETIGPGINYTHAPQVWALGVRGEGIVVASADTGVRWTHHALKAHYRGWNGTTANHNYNWHDAIHNGGGNPCGNNAPAPCDDSGHGSHTTGTAIGDDGAGNQIGMAPGGKWIACRNMDQGDGTPARYIECMEFFLAPYPVGGNPNQGDPTRAPDITNNSWGCPPSEGCSANTLQAAVEAQAAAGIMMVVAAGNYGYYSICSTVEDPPAIYAASYTVGSLNTGTDTIAFDSSLGPVTIDASNRIKPDITAPGTNIRSASNTSDTAYANLSGTSMAAPHIAGAMALLWSAAPALRHNISGSRAALNNSAVHILSALCGGSGPPNNVYGWGRVDIFAAVRRARAAGGDFNNDGHPDYLLYNSGTYQTAIWYMRNNVHIGSASGPTLPAWLSLAGSADFNADGHPDYLLFNANTRGTVIWHMRNNVHIGSASGPTLPAWLSLAGSADINLDGYPDYVLYNANTRGTVIWYMRNNVHIGSASGPTLPAWLSLAGSADFNADGHPDYLLYNANTHGTVIWYLTGVTHTTSRSGPVITAGYDLTGVADFDRNGRPDYLLYNPGNRQTAIWYMNDNVRIGTAWGPTLPRGWSLIAP